MGMPVISINFKESAINTIERSDNSVLLLILRDTVPQENPAVVTSAGDIPALITEKNKEYIKLALIGNVTRPQKIYCYFIEGDESEVTPALTWAETKRIDWVACPTATTTSAASAIAQWVKNVNDNSNNYVMAVLPQTVADSEYIVNWDVEKVVSGGVEYTAEEYTARIAGLICGTPEASSITYAVLSDASECTAMTKAEMNAAVDAGKLICFYDGEKVKLGRGVNSLTTTTDVKGAQFKKVKIAEAISNIKYDLYRAVEDGYIGKFANTYANRQMLLSAIKDYFDVLVGDALISDYTAVFDIEAIKAAMRTAKIDYSSMSDDQIEAYNFGTTVYIAVSCRMIDAIEDITINIAI